MESQQPPALRRSLFWDVDFDGIQWDEKYQFVIERVLERGTLDEWKVIKQYYGLDKIKQTALHARWLDQTTLSFCSAVFAIPVEKFRCYTLKSLNPAPWVF